MGGLLPVIHLILRHFIEAGGPILHQFIMIVGAHFFCPHFFSDVGSEDIFVPVKKCLGYYSIEKISCKDLGLDRLKKENKGGPQSMDFMDFCFRRQWNFFTDSRTPQKKIYRRDFFNSSSLKIYRAPKEKDRLPAIFFQGLC